MAEQSLEGTIAGSGHARHFEQGAMIVMEHDGAVRALVGGKDYGESQFNRAAAAYRQPGSSLASTSISPRSRRENTRRTPS